MNAVVSRSKSGFQLHPDTADDPHDLIGSFRQLRADPPVRLPVFSDQAFLTDGELREVLPGHFVLQTG